MKENSQLQFVWKKILEHAKTTITPLSFSNAIEDLQPYDISGRKIVLKVPTVQNAKTLQFNTLGQKLRESIIKADVGLVDFHLYVEGSDIYTLPTEADAMDGFVSSPINKQFTFDSFVVGPANKLVYAAAKAVANNPGEGEVFNPLFIYGESGLGKTHILHAIANEIAENHPEKKVLYTTCENFLNEFIDSIAQKNGAKFRYHYRNVDVLMIDDVQFLKNKTQVQEEFFHTFNELSSQNKQIVLTSDRPPREISTLEERLRTRFEGGLIADIQPPSQETKIAILKRKALDKKCSLSNDVLEFLSKNSGHDVRTLEGRLNKVIFASKLHETPITLELAKKALSESINETDEAKEDLTPEKIISAVCSYFKQKKEDLLGKGKKAEIVKARQICAYLMCEMLSLPLVSIGNVLGGRDHTTIMYARDKMENLAKLNDAIAGEIEDIKSVLFKTAF